MGSGAVNSFEELTKATGTSKYSRLQRELRLAVTQLRGRAFEASVWLGLPLLGVSRSAPGLDARSGLWLGGTLLLILHMLAFNDWAGWRLNAQERHRYGPLEELPQHPSALLIASLLYLGIGQALLFEVSPGLAALGLVWALLSFLYSHPASHLKVHAMGSGAVHFFAGVLLYELGHGYASGPTLSGWPVGVFLGLVLLAGSLNHQAIDVEEDRAASFSTPGARMGVRRAVTTSAGLFLLAHSWLVTAWAFDLCPTRVALPLSVPALASLAALFTALRGSVQWNAELARRYRLSYRGLFALALVVSCANGIGLPIR